MATSRAPVRFLVKEHSDGHPFLLVEPYGGHVGVLEGKSLTIDLVHGVNYDAAKTIADVLNERVRSIAITD